MPIDVDMNTANDGLDQAEHDLIASLPTEWLREALLAWQLAIAGSADPMYAESIVRAMQAELARREAV